MLHKEKRKHSQEQQASNLIARELVKTNKTAAFKENSKISKNSGNSHIPSYAILREASKIHIIELYSCGCSWLWSRYGPRVLPRPQAANRSSSVTDEVSACEY